MNKKIAITGALLIMTGIILGAFGAHALKEAITEVKLSSYETGVRYQIYHGFALLLIGLSSDRIKFDLKWIYVLMLTGTLLFSISIYFLAISELIGEYKFLGPITPVGGMVLILSWALFIKKLLS